MNIHMTLDAWLALAQEQAERIVQLEAALEGERLARRQVEAENERLRKLVPHSPTVDDFRAERRGPGE